MPVSVHALGHRFGDAWLFGDVTFSVPQQGSVAVVGPSGSGKSTLLRILAGTLAPTEGSVEIPPTTRISLVHQTPHGVGPRTVIDHIALPWWARGADLRTGWHEAERIAATLGLDGALLVRGGRWAARRAGADCAVGAPGCERRGGSVARLAPPSALGQLPSREGGVKRRRADVSTLK